MDKNKHHYIPRFLLKGFSKDEQIYLYRHDTKKIFCTSIYDAFTQNNLNTLFLRNGVTDKNTVEDIYDKYFESKASISIKKIIEDLAKIPPCGKDFSVDDFLHLLRFCILSNLRSPFSLGNAHHALRVSSYSMIMLKYFLDKGTVHFPYDLDIEKGLLFKFLDNFDEATKLLFDLKLTLYYHRIPDSYFLIPDQHVVLLSPNNNKFADKKLKMYFPISSNVVVCFERVERNFTKGTCELDENGVSSLNRLFAKNSFDSFGCENEEYLTRFIAKNKNDLTPLKKFNPNSDFKKEKEQIKIEIISKLAINLNGNDYSDGFITRLDRDHKFTILTEMEFQKIRKEMDGVVDIKKRVIEI